MPKISLKISLAGLPEIVIPGKVETVSDLPKLFKKASASLKAAASVFPDVNSRKVLRIAVKDE